MKKEYILIMLLAVLKFALPFFLQDPSYELHRDEYLYYEQGQHLDWGFLENPPLIGIMSAISGLFGGSVFWIKFWPCLMGALTMIVTAGIVKEFGGGMYAIFVAAMGLLFTAYLRIHFLFQPNMMDVFFWPLSAYFLLRYINTKEVRHLYFVSLALALGWWGKYSVLFFILASVTAILLTHHRKLFLNKHFWTAFLLGFVLIIPNLLWQYNHHWPLAHHMEELRETQLKYISKANFLKEQMLMLVPVVFVWVGGLVWLLRNPLYRVVGLMFLITVLLIMLGSGKGYYTLGAYPMLLAAGGVWLEKWTTKRVAFRYALVMVILVLALPFIPLLMPMQKAAAMAVSNQKWGIEKLGLLTWEDQKTHPLQQDFADMQGWKELTDRAETFYHSLPINSQTETILYCRSYGQAGALKYHANDKNFASKIICDNGTFLLWIPNRIYFKNLLFIGGHIPDKDDAVFTLFKKYTVIDSVRNPLSRQFGDKIIYYESSDSAWKLANEDLKEMKAEFGE